MHTCLNREKTDDANRFMPFVNCTNLVVLMANSCKIPAESKDFGLLGGKACLCPKEVFEMFRIW